MRFAMARLTSANPTGGPLVDPRGHRPAERMRCDALQRGVAAADDASAADAPVNGLVRTVAKPATSIGVTPSSLTSAVVSGNLRTSQPPRWGCVRLRGGLGYVRP
jgi:hypothetical protein